MRIQQEAHVAPTFEIITNFSLKQLGRRPDFAPFCNFYRQLFLNLKNCDTVCKIASTSQPCKYGVQDVKFNQDVCDSVYKLYDKFRQYCSQKPCPGYALVAAGKYQN